MAQIVVRNLDGALKERLRMSAAAHGRSMEEEARVILHNALPEGAVPSEPDTHDSLSQKIHALFVNIDVPDEFFEALDEIRHGSELIDVEPRPFSFDE